MKRREKRLSVLKGREGNVDPTTEEHDFVLFLKGWQRELTPCKQQQQLNYNLAMQQFSGTLLLLLLFMHQIFY